MKKKWNRCLFFNKAHTKKWLAMKLCFVFLMVFMVSGYANINAQNQLVTLDLRNASYYQLFNEINKQTGLHFVYNTNQLRQLAAIDVHAENKKVKELLDEVLAGTSFSYIFDNNVVVLKLNSNQPQQKIFRVSGVVLDDKKAPLPGVTIRLDSTVMGTVTNTDGKFTIQVPFQKGYLIFSFVGFKQKRVAFEAGKELTVILEEDVAQLEDVVVTGYQVIDRRKVSSAITSIQAEDLDFQGALTVDQMLEGKVPGLMISTLSATPGAATKMRLRGSTTFTGTREPLWVIDGIIYENPVPLTASDINSWDNINLIGNAISGLNPNDIERVDILKDASATAIYGTRAANGVIVITTKQGQDGDVTIGYSGNVKVVQRPGYEHFDMMNSKERIDVSREIIDKGLWFSNTPARVGYEGAVMDYWDKKINYNEFEQRVYAMESNNADWFKALYRPAISQSHSLSLSGGGNKTKYYFSVGYSDENGAEKWVDLSRITSRMNLTSKLRKNLTAVVNMSGSVQNADYVHSAYSLFDAAYYTSRTIPIYNEDGSYHYIPKLVASSDDVYAGYNILNELDRSNQKIINKSFNLTGTMSWTIVPGIKYSGTASYTSTTNTQEEWIADKTFYTDNLHLQRAPLLDKGGVYGTGTTDQSSWTLRNQLNISKMLGGKHNINVDLGQEARSTKYWGVSKTSIPGYLYDQGQKFSPFTQATALNYAYITAVNRWFVGTSPSVYPSITNREQNNLSFYGTFTYSYESLFSVNFNIRNDGSNTFGQYKRSRFNPTWSVSGRMNLTEMGFMRDPDKRNSFAIRASYGYRGNVPNASPYLLISSPTVNALLDDDIAYVTDFPNANLNWEKTSTVNTAIDYSFLRGRISGALDVYYSLSTDLLTYRKISLVNGEGQRMVNSGSATNFGVEFNIRTVNIDMKDFRWTTSFSVATNKNKIKKGEVSNVSANRYMNYLQGSVIKENQNVDGFYSYRFAGLDDRGLPRYKNLYGNDPNLTRDEVFETVFTYSGSRVPLAYGNFSTEAAYKNWRVRANFNYKVGHKVRLLQLYNGAQSLPLPERNMQRTFTQRWRNPGDKTDIPALSNEYLNMSTTALGPITPQNEWTYTMVDAGYDRIIGPSSNTGWFMYDYSDIRVAKGDFIRIRDISLGYNFPKKWMDSIGLQNARMDFQVQNVGVIVFDKKLKGQDPEQVQHVGMPTLPTYSVNLSFNF